MPKSYPPELEQFVQQELATGKYQSEDELVIAALTVFRELNTRYQHLRDDVQRAIVQADQGEVAPLDVATIKSEVTRQLDEQGQPT